MAAVVRKRGERGLTLVELIVAFTILSILTAMSVPLARYKVKRDKERELREALHEIHRAIDNYKDAATQNLIQTKLGTEGYPENLEQLVEGVTLSQSPDGKKVKFLRRIPKDPMTGTYDWGKRSMQDDPHSQSWGGQNVFSVYTKSTETARDGTKYSDW
jgi:general secretion pathway protein G